MYDKNKGTIKQQNYTTLTMENSINGNKKSTIMLPHAPGAQPQSKTSWTA
jgi:hypothetical protein